MLPAFPNLSLGSATLTDVKMELIKPVLQEEGTDDKLFQ
jgi:hypothetical protein